VVVRAVSAVVQLHLHMNLDGTVLSWGHDGDPQVWNPANGTFTAVRVLR